MIFVDDGFRITVVLLAKRLRAILGGDKGLSHLLGNFF